MPVRIRFGGRAKFLLQNFYACFGTIRLACRHFQQIVIQTKMELGRRMSLSMFPRRSVGGPPRHSRIIAISAALRRTAAAIH